MGARSCPDCRYSGTPGRHIIDPAEGRTDFAADELADLEPYEVPCPNVAADDERQRLEKIVADQHTTAFKAAKEVLRDAAHAMAELDANRIRDLFDKAQVPTPLRGSAVRWAANEGNLLEPTGRRVMSTEPSTRHRVDVWRSKVYGRRQSA